MKSSFLAAAVSAAAGAPSVKHTTAPYREESGLSYFILNAWLEDSTTPQPLGISTLSSKSTVSDYKASGPEKEYMDINLGGLGNMTLNYIADTKNGRSNIMGILGLGLQVSANADPGDSPVLMMKEAGIIPKPVIGLDVTRKDKCNITWGGIDADPIEGDSISLPKIGDDHWSFPLFQVSLGDYELERSRWSAEAAIVTDQDEIRLESSLLEDLRRALSSDLVNMHYGRNGLYTTSSCKTAKKLMKDITFRTLGYDIILTPDALPMEENNDGHCVLGIHEADKNDKISTFGQVFLDSFYVGLDYEEEEILLGVKKRAVGKVAIQKIGGPPTKEDAPSDARSDPVVPHNSDGAVLNSKIKDLETEVASLKSEIASWTEDSSGSGLRLTWCRQNPASSWLGVFLQSMRSGYPLLELWGCQLQVNPGLLWKLVAPLEDWKLATK